MNEKIELFTNGSCIGNPGPGGWAYLLRQSEEEALTGGSEKYTTNNRLELIAAIKGLEAAKPNSKVHVFTGSKYVVDGITCWIKKWKAQGWLLHRFTIQSVKNTELWQQLDKLCQSREVTWEWVRSRSAPTESKQVDAEARKQSKLARAA
ncbi:ribonuclease H family protein [Thalassospira marina]|uniref:ribonuclease H n=1 Tax=Thalassospira marina TaxID=2048283 RepID=A0A2N3KUF7_9PROT|nr:ribonuclease H [Thalassospira marina]PKR54204.1 ribonuclease HI [Thalassospira marina]